MEQDVSGRVGVNLLYQLHKALPWSRANGSHEGLDFVAWARTAYTELVDTRGRDGADGNSGQGCWIAHNEPLILALYSTEYHCVGPPTCLGAKETRR